MTPPMRRILRRFVKAASLLALGGVRRRGLLIFVVRKKPRAGSFDLSQAPAHPADPYEDQDSGPDDDWMAWEDGKKGGSDW